MTESVPIYLTQNVNRIKQIGTHDLGKWSIKYEAPEFASFDVISELKSEFPSKNILREDVSRLFKEERVYLAFIAAMVWGFIDASRPRVSKGGRTTTNFFRVLSHDEKAIVAIIEHVRNELLSGEIKTCFSDMRRGGKHNIAGIDYPYFTKLFFFLGQSDENIKLKPLILDKWTTNAYFALLSQTRPKDVSNLFRCLQTVKAHNKPGTAALKIGSALAITYESYVQDMNTWASTIGVTPDKLEQFIFGMSLKSNKIPDNPRKELWEISVSNAAKCGIPVR